MNIPKEAVEKAIEGGWDGLEWHEEIRIAPSLSRSYGGMIWGYSKEGEAHGANMAEVSLDPTFWQALGKALGWRVDTSVQVNGNVKGEWNYYAHVFIDLVLTDRDTDTFWKELLAPKE